jgi:signal transduction histidine kinase
VLSLCVRLRSWQTGCLKHEESVLKTLSQILLTAMTVAQRHLEFADAEALRLGAIDDVDTQALRHSIEVATNRLSRALLFHHVLAGDVKPGISPVPVSYLIDDIIVAARAILGQSDITIHTEVLGGDIWPLDRELILEVAYHAVVIAAEHARSQVCLSARLDDGTLVLRVEDDGNGFATLDESSFHERGFGLYVAQHVAKLHQRNGRVGRVTIANGSSLGGGVFSLFLP